MSPVFQDRTAKIGFFPEIPAGGGDFFGKVVLSHLAAHGGGKHSEVFHVSQALDGGGWLLEEQRGEGLEVETPVLPLVAAFGDEEGVLEAFLGEDPVEGEGSFVEEVGLADTYPVELVAGLLDGTQLGADLRGIL